MIKLVAATAAAFCLAGAAMAAPDATEIAGAFRAALERGDQAAAAALLADDLTVYEEGHVEASKAEYVAGHLPDDIRFSSAVATRAMHSRTITHGDTAWVVSEGETHGTFDGKPVDRITTETMILRLDVGGWRIVHIHWSSHKKPAASQEAP